MEDYLEPGSLTWRQAEALRRLLPEGTRIEHLSRWGSLVAFSPYRRGRPPSAVWGLLLPGQSNRGPFGKKLLLTSDWRGLGCCPDSQIEGRLAARGPMWATAG
jgi:hypothetical protein